MADINTVYMIIAALLEVTLDVADVGARHSLRAFQLLELYGPPGLFLFLFGSKMTWHIEAQILGQMIDEDALAFKKYIQDECTMVSVAVRTSFWLCRWTL